MIRNMIMMMMSKLLDHHNIETYGKICRTGVHVSATQSEFELLPSGLLLADISNSYY